MMSSQVFFCSFQTYHANEVWNWPKHDAVAWLHLLQIRLERNDKFINQSNCSRSPFLRSNKSNFFRSRISSIQKCAKIMATSLHKKILEYPYVVPVIIIQYSKFVYNRNIWQLDEFRIKLVSFIFICGFHLLWTVKTVRLFFSDSDV